MEQILKKTNGKYSYPKESRIGTGECHLSITLNVINETMPDSEYKEILLNELNDTKYKGRHDWENLGTEMIKNIKEK